MKRIILIALVLSSVLLAACSGSAAPTPVDEVIGQEVPFSGGTYTDISVAELQTLLTEMDFVFVNVHIPFEGDIPNTDLSIPFDEMEANLNQLPTDKDAKIVLYCRSGNMSSVAATDLVSQGYTDIWNLSGGFNAWKAAGLPMEGSN